MTQSATSTIGSANSKGNIMGAKDEVLADPKTVLFDAPSYVRFGMLGLSAGGQGLDVGVKSVVRFPTVT